MFGRVCLWWCEGEREERTDGVVWLALVQPWQWREIEPLEQKRGNRSTTNPYSLTNPSQIAEDNKELLQTTLVGHRCFLHNKLLGSLFRTEITTR